MAFLSYVPVIDSVLFSIQGRARFSSSGSLQVQVDGPVVCTYNLTYTRTKLGLKSHQLCLLAPPMSLSVPSLCSVTHFRNAENLAIALILFLPFTPLSPVWEQIPPLFLVSQMNC